MAASQWTCAICTFINYHESKACYACEATPKHDDGSTDGAAGGAGGFGGAGGAASGSVELDLPLCPHCSLPNEATATVCIGCHKSLHLPAVGLDAGEPVAEPVDDALYAEHAAAEKKTAEFMAKVKRAMARKSSTTLTESLMQNLLDIREKEFIAWLRLQDDGASKALMYEMSREFYLSADIACIENGDGIKFYLGSAYNAARAKDIEMMLESSSKGHLTIVNCCASENPPLLENGVVTNISVICAKWIDDKDTVPSIDDLNRVLDEIEFAIREGDSIFVHCREGKSRSAALMLAIQRKFYNVPFKTTLAALQKMRQFNDGKVPEPNKGLMRLLRKWEVTL